MPLPPTLRRLLVPLVLAAGLLAVPSGAFASDCAHQIIDQAYKGKITGTYSQACYNQAIKIEPVDGSSYSDIDSIIKQAKRTSALAATDGKAVSTPTVAKTDPVRTQQQIKSEQTTTVVQTTPPATSTPSTTSPASVGGGRVDPQKPGATSNATSGGTKTSTPDDKPTLLGAPSATPVLDRLAPAHAGDVPIAVIVLGVLAVLLVLAGVAGALLRRRSNRLES
jgi:hypothetical protein